MKNAIRALTIVLLIGMAGIYGATAMAQDAGEEVIKRGVINEDVYAAGESVTVDANVTGDVLAAGGEVTVAGQVSADVMAAGGQVEVRANVGDDVRVFGGQLDISADIGDQLIAAGGKITVESGTRVGGGTWLAGGDVTVDGRLGHGLLAAGGNISVSGQVEGDVELTGDSIRIEPGAVIRGDLVWRSDHEIRIDKKATITGSVVREPMPYGEGPGRATGTIMSILTLFVSVMILAYFFPGFLGGAGEILRTRFGRSLLTGFILLIMIPVAIVLLFVTVVGWLAGLVMLALYFVAIAIAMLVGVRTLTELGARQFKQELAGSWWRLALAVALTLVALSLVGLIPVVGGLVWFLLLIGGLGAGGIELYQRYRAV
jgi:cytoskeletal protein CcmA (bactofilin family)